MYMWPVSFFIQEIGPDTFSKIFSENGAVATIVGIIIWQFYSSIRQSNLDKTVKDLIAERDVLMQKIEDLEQNRKDDEILRVQLRAVLSNTKRKVISLRRQIITLKTELRVERALLQRAGGVKPIAEDPYDGFGV